MRKPNSNPFSLAGKKILVTGASSGIGSACAIELSKLGADIVLVSRRQEQLHETYLQMNKGDHHIEPFDIATGESAVLWMKDVALRHGSLDGIVHAAGTVTILPVRATSQESFQRIMATNVESTFFLSKAFRQKGVRGPTGSVVIIGSVMGLVGQTCLSAYCASKGALVAMTKSLALELASEKIRVNLIAPGYVQTPMSKEFNKSLPDLALKTIEANHPLGIGRPEDVAYAAGYLLSEAARWITGATLVVDGGYTAS